MFPFNSRLKDKRSRYYIPVKRIVANNNVEFVDLLIGNEEYQLFMHHIRQTVKFPPASSVVLDFGAAFHGGIRMNFPCQSAKIKVTFGESVSEAIGTPDQSHSCKSTILDLPCCGMTEYGNTVFRFVKIENVTDETIECQNIIGVALERDIEVTGSFNSSDERLNKIWKTAIRTVHLCMQDYLYDGAKRDRIVWMGDMHPEIKGIHCAFSDNSIIRDSLEFIVRQTPEGKPINGICSYPCWFIISVWEYFMATADYDFLQKNAYFIESTLKMYSAFVDGNGRECIPERRFLDWPNNDNEGAKHAGLQALLYWMMIDGAKILNIIEKDSSFAVNCAEKLKKHLPSPCGRKAPAALLTLNGFGDFRNVLEDRPFNDVSTFYGYYMLLAKDTVPALELIRRYWGAMLDFGATSFWEDFDLEWVRNASPIDRLPQKGKDDLHADFGNYCYKGLRHSLSHGWSCGPAPFLSERVLGVRFLAPGGSKIAVKPDLGDLEYVEGTFPTPHGIIKISADKSGKVSVDAPDNVDII